MQHRRPPRIRQTKIDARIDEQVIPLFGEVDVHLPSPEEIRQRSKGDKGFTKETLASWGVQWPPPKGWRERLEQQWRERETI